MNVGVVGLGYWGKKVAREYRDLLREGVIDNLYLCDVFESNIREFKKECEECVYLTNYRELANKVDGVHICTPNPTHYELANYFVNENVNVMVEKPMTIKYREARKLAYLAYNRNLVLAVGHIFRFNNAVRKVRNLYKKGEMGKLYYAKLQWSNLMPAPHERDIIYDLAPHPFDILNFIVEDWPIRVATIGKAYRRENLEEVAYINAEYENDVIANIEISWIYPEKIRRVTLVGDKKSIMLEAVKQEIRVYDMNNGGWKDIKITPNNTIRDEALHFVRAIKNKVTPINDGFNAAENVKVLEACLRSLKEKNVVELEW